jgi:type IV pilus assembly protein PilY1
MHSAQANSTIIVNPTSAISSTQIDDVPFIFQTEFNRSTWSGNLKKMSLTQPTNGGLVISQKALWDAGTQLSKLPPEQRTIATYNSTNNQTVAFDLEQLPDNIQTLFHIAPHTKIKDELGVERVRYLRGERTMESKNTNPTISQFRIRDSILGDIMHSAPVYVGAPAKNIVDANYSSFYEQYKKRPAAVFVGANDGMLHAFSADTGAELFAYIPSPLLNKLPKLTDPSYQHESIMDGNIHVAEAQISDQWKTVLTAGLGHGAKGLFALDVTSPDKFMEGKRALFEFTEQDDADMGYITSPPSIAKISIGINKNGSINYEYFVAVSSGFNPSNPGQTFLFLLSLDKDPRTPWSKNTNYFKLSTNNNNAATANVLSTPGLALNAQRAAIYAYSGDLQGNVWRFDFTSNNPTAILPKIIFTAQDKHNNPQSITAQPVVSYAPDGGHLVLFGTGKNTDIKNNYVVQNSFYAIRDLHKNSNADDSIATRSQLAARELVKATIKGKTGYQVTGQDFTYGTSSSDKKGWYVDYPNDSLATNKCREHSITNGVLAFGSIFFNTIIPNTPLCNEVGTGHSYALNAVTGKSDITNNLTGLKSQVGMPGVPVLVTTQTSIADRDSIGRRYNLQHYSVLNFGTGGIKGTAEVINSEKVVLKAGRLSWRELSNWQDLKK